MLSNNSLETPRPKPPARLRHSASARLPKSSPPPPYAATPFPKKPDDGVQSGPSAELCPQPPDLEQHHSDTEWGSKHEELSQLLLRADVLIKDREIELDLTSAVRRSIHENNISLRNKHEKLLARIPSASPSPVHSPSPSIVSLGHSLHHTFRSPSPGFAHSSPFSSGSRPNRVRRISLSRNDIATLSEQNYELLQRLEKLEADSTQADQVGRRQLRKLEKEIQVLKDELEKTQAKSEQLEEQTRKAMVGSIEDMIKRREEREERIKALRNKSAGQDGEVDDVVRDFAPGSALTRSQNSPQSPTFSASEQDAPSATVGDASTNGPAQSGPPIFPQEKDKPSEKSRYSSLRAKASFILSTTEPQVEVDIISKLLSKIRELEEINSQISVQQAETSTRLKAVQEDAENISKIYDILDDNGEVELEFIVDEDREESTVKDDSFSTEPIPIRFQSLGQLFQGATTGPGKTFERGISDQSTIRSLNMHGPSATKTRKSVVGLFDGPSASVTANTSDLYIPASMAEKDDTRFRFDSLEEQFSPSMSALSITPSFGDNEEASPTTERRGTLGSELGSEYNDDWGVKAGNHHFKTSSLYDLSRLSSAPSPLRSPEAPPDSLLPATPTPNRTRESSNLRADQSNSDEWRKTQSVRQNLLSRTIRSRTSQWIDGRSSDSLVHRDTVQSSADGEASSSTQKAAILNKVSQGGESDFKDKLPEGTNANDVSAVQLHPGLGLSKNDPTKPKLLEFILEVWLWVQFAIIIFVFLWAMAKRGPKSILAEAERRRTDRPS